ncbi:MAG: hypothetical protein WDZ51_19460 [Pirellulaceae bacterium]
MAKGNRPLKLSDIEKPPLGEGENPFVEHAEVLGDDAPEMLPGTTYQVGRYEQTQNPRGNGIVVCGIISIMMVVACLMLREFNIPFMWLIPVAGAWTFLQTLLVIILAIPTAIWGRLELQAIAHGVTPSTQFGRTRVGTSLAWLALGIYIVEMISRTILLWIL